MENGGADPQIIGNTGLSSWNPALRPDTHASITNIGHTRDCPGDPISIAKDDSRPFTDQGQSNISRNYDNQILQPTNVDAATFGTKGATEMAPEDREASDGPDTNAALNMEQMKNTRTIIAEKPYPQTTTTQSTGAERAHLEVDQSSTGGISEDLRSSLSKVPLKSSTVDADSEMNDGPALGKLASNLDLYEPSAILHTNSFPDVPLLPTKQDFPSVHPLAQSQAEDILHEIEHTRDSLRLEHKEDDVTFGSSVSKSDFDPFGASISKDEGYVSSNINGNKIGDLATGPLDEEERFEEGLPLVQLLMEPRPSSGTQTNEFTNNDQEADQFGSGAQNDGVDEDFFTNINLPSLEQAPELQPPSLHRKSTDQVLASMHLTPTSDEQRHQPKEIFNSANGNIRNESSGIQNMDVLQNEKQENEDIATVDHSMEPRHETEEELAAKWQAALADDLADDGFLEEESGVDPSAFFDADGHGFLDDVVDPSSQSSTDFSPQSHGVSISDPPSANLGYAQRQYTPQQVQAKFSPSLAQNSWSQAIHQSPYAPTNLQSPFTTSHGLIDSSGQQSTFNSMPQQRPTVVQRAQSFADQAKGGYTSPYDLPMDVSRPRKKATLPNLQNTYTRDAAAPPPPNRSSSMQPPISTPQSQGGYFASPTTSVTSNLSQFPNPMSSPAIAPPTLQPRASTSSFFEELPSTSKPRPMSSSAKILHQPSQKFAQAPQGPLPMQQFAGPPQGIVQHNQYESQQPIQHQPLQQEPIQRQQPPSTPQDYQLVQPERVLPFAEASVNNVPTHSLPSAAGTRYSPAPASQPSMPLNRNRYSTSQGPPRPPSVSQIMPFQPRTSSPLARSTSASQQIDLNSQNSNLNLNSGAFPTEARRFSLRSTQTERPMPSNVVPSNLYSMAGLDPAGSGRHHPLAQTQILSPETRNFQPGPRAQTQSPRDALPRQDSSQVVHSQIERRASINDPTSLSMAYLKSAPQQELVVQQPARGRAPSQVQNFIFPSDGRENDLLQRWKGCPILAFGFGGHIVTSFPKQIPRYAAGQTMPMIKCSPGEVKVQTGKMVLLEEHVISFPGPLKAKSKKREVLEWLDKAVIGLGLQYVQIISNQTPVDARMRHDEKILLWRIVRVLVEYDGLLEDNPAAQIAVRNILSPELVSAGPTDQTSYETNLLPTGISRSNATKAASLTVEPEAVEALRKELMRGDREKAVWHAVDQRLWGHAMLIASTLRKEVWRQVAHEFVRQEVKNVGDNTESLAVLYDVFAGNWEESIDELVPPSARAGLQMVSKTMGAGATKNGLDGLDRWRETLGLILGNRSVDDNKALIALGHLLTTYGRVEAAHICFIFAKTPGLFGGPDDIQASFALLGANHQQQPFDYGYDLDSVILTEVYDFATSVLASSAVSSIAPHLQAPKLYHAMVLAEYGYRDEAQQYCDAITNALKATTKLSPYYHPQLFAALDDLSNRLRQAPKDGSSSWIPRPSINGGSVWNRFTQFVSGDESDAGSAGSASAIDPASGPFARVAGDTPVLSRSSSPSNPYGLLANGGNYAPPLAPTPQGSSRYTPGGQPSQQFRQNAPMSQPVLQQQSSYAALPTSPPDIYGAQQQTASAASYTPNPGAMATMGSSPNEKYQPVPSLQSMPSLQSIPLIQRHHSEMPSMDQSSPPNSRPYRSDTQSPSSLYDKPLPSLGQEPPSLMSLPSISSTSRPNLSPYEPRSRSYGPSPTTSGPRSASYEAPPLSSHGPRSYQHSPVRDKPLPSPGEEQSSSYEPQYPSYEPQSASYEPKSASYEPRSSSLEPPSTSLQPSSASYDQSTYNSYQPPSAGYQSSGYEPPSASLEPPSASLEPHSASYEPHPSSSFGYEPPSASYEPNDPEGGVKSSELSPRKKKSFMDDSDDNAVVAKKAKKAKADKEAEEAFRRAAEADAKKDTRPAASASKGSWFGSWLGKGKESEENISGTKTKPIKARLGEESSFVYDAALKKWVNKKGGPEAATSSAPTPPPPRTGPPSRAVSSQGGPLSASREPKSNPLQSQLSPPSSLPSSVVPSRNVSPSIGSMTFPNPTSDSGLLSPEGEASAVTGSNLGLAPPPPSRPSTGMSVSTASSIDDLIGAAGPRKGGTVKKSRKGRGYVDVMAK